MERSEIQQREGYERSVMTERRGLLYGLNEVKEMKGNTEYEVIPRYEGNEIEGV